MKKILLATDGSPGSLKAAKKAASLARSIPGGQATLVVVNIAPLHLIDLATDRLNMSGEDVLPTELEVRLKKNSEDILAATLKQIEGVEGIQTRSLLGHPSDAICDVAEEIGADLIVVGSGGHSKLHKLFLGSVSNQIVSHSPCDVLVVKS
jgi:nucleotide-binding universal stress UspA family protein